MQLAGLASQVQKYVTQLVPLAFSLEIFAFISSNATVCVGDEKKKC